MNGTGTGTGTGTAGARAPHVQFRPAEDRIDRPWYAWLAAVLAGLTGVAAVPVGLMFIADPSGAAIQLPASWIEGTVFGSYLVPGLYLLVVNGLGMLLLAGLVVARHWVAPWLAGGLGVGLVVWIAVQLAIMPETMFLQAVFLAVGLVLAAVSVAWLRRSGQLRLR